VPRSIAIADPQFAKLNVLRSVAAIASGTGPEGGRGDNFACVVKCFKAVRSALSVDDGNSEPRGRRKLRVFSLGAGPAGGTGDVNFWDVDVHTGGVGTSCSLHDRGVHIFCTLASHFCAELLPHGGVGSTAR